MLVVNDCLTSSEMSPFYILLFLFFTVVPLWQYYRGVFPVAMPLHVVSLAFLLWTEQLGKTVHV